MHDLCVARATTKPGGGAPGEALAVFFGGGGRRGGGGEMDESQHSKDVTDETVAKETNGRTVSTMH